MRKKIDLGMSVKERNQQLADENHKVFKSRNLKVFNLISSPGAGKTMLLEKLADRLKGRLAVIVGDLATTRDADRIKKHGCQAVQIETGGGCHLNAEMVRIAFEKINPEGVEILVIENVGNLVCPAAYELGEDKKIAMLSLPEGDDKPAKYPTLFLRADIVIISKIDLAPVMDFNLEQAEGDCLKLNSKAKIVRLSAKTGEGLDDLINHFTGT